VEAAQNRLLSAPPPQTLVGVRAMAELCRAKAQPTEDGQLDYSHSYCGPWPGWVVEAVLRLVPQR
jgi:hypothetical protein